MCPTALPWATRIIPISQLKDELDKIRAQSHVVRRATGQASRRHGLECHDAVGGTCNAVLKLMPKVLARNHLPHPSSVHPQLQRQLKRCNSKKA